MKYFFSLWLILISTQAYGHPVILLNHESNHENVEIVHSLLLKKFFIPDNLITRVTEPSPCKANDKAVIHLCIDEKGEMKILKVDQKVMKEVLGVFYEN